MKNFMNSIQVKVPNSNMFDLTHDVKTTTDMARLTPILAMECVPGDRITLGCECMIRLAPMVAPIMQRIDQTVHYFFVPNRLLWPNWEDYITQRLGDPLPAFPTLKFDNGSNSAGIYEHPGISTLPQYLGVPKPSQIGDNAVETVSALPFAAVQFIYSEYFRDQNLENPIVYELVDGDNQANRTALISLRVRAWERDLFTAALPFAQKGDGVGIPLGTIQLADDLETKFPVWRYADPANPLITVPGDGSINQNYADLNPPPPFGIYSSADAASTRSEDRVVYDPDETLEVAPTTINDLRRAFRLQEWLEKAARGGSRYIEHIKAFFGVTSSDKRLQRPEFIVSVKSPVRISEVLNTTGTEDAPQGSMAGHGISTSGGRYGKYFCEEHGYIIALASVMPKTSYWQGIARHFKKYNSPFDFFYPEFAHIGEQEVRVNEIYAYTNTNIFGYMPRYYEYRFINSMVTGQFADQLMFWHAGRYFAEPPVLNAAFIQGNPTKRIFAVTDPAVDSLWCHYLHKIAARRLMPKYGNPSF